MNIDAIIIVNILFLMFARSVTELSTLRTNGSKLCEGSFQPSVETELLTVGSQLSHGVATL